MVSTGSKFFFGLAIAGLFAAIVYGMVTTASGAYATLSGNGAVDAILGPLTLGYKGGIGDHVGYVVLMAFAACSTGLGVATSVFRDADPKALAELAGGDAVPPVVRAKGLSFWPVVTAVAGALVVVGLATSSALFIAGVVLGIIAVVEWTVTAWSDGATGDPAANAAVRSRLMAPIEFPVGAVMGIGVIVLMISRIFLTLSKTGSIVAASALAALFFVVAVIMSSRPDLRRSTVAAVLVGLTILVLGLGIYGAIEGSREFEKKGEGAVATTPVRDSAGAPVVGETR